jgi:hypothetical protein
MAGAWNEGDWGVGNFGEQNNITVPVTSVVDSPLAWNVGNFGGATWGGQFDNIGITLGDETSAGEINEGWGRLTWGENVWGGTGDVIVEGLQLNTSLNSVGFSITAEVPVTGLQLVALSPVITTSNLQNVSGTSDNILFTFRPGASSKVQYVGLGWNVVGQPTFIVTSVTLDPNDQYTGTITITGGTFVSGQSYQFESPNIQAFGLAVVDVIGQQLNIAEGDVDASPDAIVTGQQINTSLNSVTVTAEINSGWGRRGWGIFDWGSDGLSVITSVTGQQLNISQGDESSSANADVPVFSIVNAGWGQVAWGTQDWGQGELNINLTIAEGEVDPSPDATVTGIGMTVSLAVGTVVIGTANVSVTGEQLNIAQGTAEGIPNTIASVTGIGLNIAIGTVFAGGTSVIEVTGNGLTIALNSINNQIWTEINTGTDATWIEIDTAA